MKIKIEGNRKMKLIVYLLDMICYKMQLIEVPKLVSIRLKKTERKNLSRWTDNFSIHCIWMAIYHYVDVETYKQVYFYYTYVYTSSIAIDIRVDRIPNKPKNECTVQVNTYSFLIKLMFVS